MICALLLGSLLPVVSAAQEVRGTVTLVGSGEAVSGALLSLLDADSTVRATTLSDASGDFQLRGPAGVEVKLRVQHVGLSTIESVPVTLRPEEPLQLEIRMRAAPLSIEGVEVTGTMRPELRDFLDRRANGFGRTFIREEIEALGRTSTDALLAIMSGSLLVPAAGGSIVARTTDPRDPFCNPRVYVDGFELNSETDDPHPTRPGVPVTSWVPFETIMGVEIYRNPAQAPPQFQRSFMPDCPVVLLWTNYTFGVGR